MLGTANLTNNSAEQKLTAPGQAHFAGTGPTGKTCGECKFKGYRRRIVKKSGEFSKAVTSAGCAKFFELTRTHGPAISKFQQACKYFEPGNSRG
jgi:hypothetical protein